MYYDQVAQIEAPAWSAGRVVLAGQGASLGITGGYVLAEQLARADTIEAGLARYERDLRPVVTDKQRVARDGTKWFLPASTRQLRIRRAVLRLARLPVVDRYVAAALAGKSTAVIAKLRANTPVPQRFPGSSRSTAAAGR